MGRPNKLRAIDLYSGVGGWSLGLHMAGIKVVASYEWSEAANETNCKNNRHPVHTVDIRALKLKDLPSDIDVVVGSPPCTQFSYSNRGGSGDIADGLVDIIKFLTIVDHLKPRHWAMENVPRVANVIEAELGPKGRLRRFAHLLKSVQVVNMEDFGLPQRRRRCIAGNFDFDLLRSYGMRTSSKTLGETISSFYGETVTDISYGVTINRSELCDHVMEDFLSEEEAKINKASKQEHTVYNQMPFPDSLTRSARTITATSTRISRESVVIRDLVFPTRFRRLTIRESASLQGFPVTYQFFGKTYNNRLKMVGNAVPPIFSLLVAQAFGGVPAERLLSPANAIHRFRPPEDKPTELKPERVGKRYSQDRRFRFAIPSLRLKSGVRFELINTFEGQAARWGVNFYFGTAKSIETIQMDDRLYKKLIRKLPNDVQEATSRELASLCQVLRAMDTKNMHNVWTHRSAGENHPFDLLDRLSLTGEKITVFLQPYQAEAEVCIAAALNHHYANGHENVAGIDKIKRLASLTLAGLLVGSITNLQLSSLHNVDDEAAESRVTTVDSLISLQAA
jgi:DNA (cytosine-5)-methyltransferase 1